MSYLQKYWTVRNALAELIKTEVLSFLIWLILQMSRIPRTPAAICNYVWIEKTIKKHQTYHDHDWRLQSSTAIRMLIFVPKNDSDAYFCFAWARVGLRLSQRKYDTFEKILSFKNGSNRNISMMFRCSKNILT